MISILEPRISRCLVVEWSAMTQYDGVDAKNYALLGMLESATCFNLGIELNSGLIAER